MKEAGAAGASGRRIASSEPSELTEPYAKIKLPDIGPWSPWAVVEESGFAKASSTRYCHLTRFQEAPTPSAPRILSNKETLSRLRVFRKPPDGFNPLKATKRQLATYGLPPPPDRKRQPKLAALWRKHMADRPEHVVPEFRVDRSFVRAGGYRGKFGTGGIPPPDNPFLTVDKRFVDRPGRFLDDFLLVRNLSPAISNNWSGAYANRPPAAAYANRPAEPFNNVFATFDVPYAQPPPSAWNGKGWNDGIYQAVTWVGLDGWNGPDVMQAGVLSRVTVTKGSVSTTYYAWVEFFPLAWVQIANFSVSPGDILAVNVIAPFTTTHAFAVLSNKTTGQLTSVGFDAPAGTVLTGVVAEWIVENPGTTPAGTFANYGNVTFHDCIAGSKTQERDLRSATRINMVDASGSVVSTGWLVSRSELRCTYGP